MTHHPRREEGKCFSCFYIVDPWNIISFNYTGSDMLVQVGPRLLQLNVSRSRRQFMWYRRKRRNQRVKVAHLNQQLPAHGSFHQLQSQPLAAAQRQHLALSGKCSSWYYYTVVIDFLTPFLPPVAHRPCMWTWVECQNSTNSSCPPVVVLVGVALSPYQL